MFEAFALSIGTPSMKVVIDGFAGLRADPAEARVGELARRELRKIGVRRIDPCVADRATKLQPVERHDRDADRQPLDVDRFFLGGYRDRRQLDRIGLPAPLRRGGLCLSR
jgi:hypothetical protein